MFRLLVFFCTISFACSCNSNADRKPERQPDSAPDQDTVVLKVPESRESLFARFPYLNADTVHLVPYIEKRSDRIEGVELDSIERELFPELPPYGAAQFSPKIFAAGKIDIGTRYVGLLARTMSFYAPTSMKFYIYDKKADSITGYTELADQFGDGGAYGEKESWLFNEEGRPIAVLSEFNAVDHTLDVPAGKGIDSTFSYYKLSFDSGRVDTVSRNNSVLKKSYPSFLKF